MDRKKPPTTAECVDEWPLLVGNGHSLTVKKSLPTPQAGSITRKHGPLAVTAVLPNNTVALVNAYFDNLLPDSDIIRRRHAASPAERQCAVYPLPHWGAIVGCTATAARRRNTANLQCIIGEP